MHAATVAYEYHNHTLTDTHLSALRLLQETTPTSEGPENRSVATYWQPLAAPPDEPSRLVGLRSVLPWLAHLHVDQGRQPLAEHQAEWAARLDLVRSTGRAHYALIEFVENDAPEAFLCDAATLKTWMKAWEE